MPPLALPHRSPAPSRWLAGAGIILAAWMTALPATAKLVVMHGHAEPTAATLWIQTDGAGALLWRHEVRAIDLRFPGTPGSRA